MAWYRVGTVSVTSGSPAVVGSGTFWIANAQAGDGFRGPDGRVYEILTVNSDTSITLAENYLGSNASGAAYGIFATQARIVALAQQVAQLLADYSGVLTGAGAGKFSDGTVAAPGMRFEADLDLGFYRIGSNTIGAAAGGVQRMVISPNGVAFGAETAYQRLDVTGSIHVAASNVDSGGYINSMGTDEIGLAGGATYNSYSAPNYVFTAKSTLASGVRTAGGSVVLWGNNALTIGATFNAVDLARFDVTGNFIQRAPAAPPALDTNGTLVLNLTSNTNLRISARGSDGVTRVANIALA